MSKIQCGQLHNELFGRRYSTLQSHGLFALAKHMYFCVTCKVSGNALLDIIARIMRTVQLVDKRLTTRGQHNTINYYADSNNVLITVTES